jgi:hypothetical protein
MACSASDNKSSSKTDFLSERQAISIAKAEIKRRHLKLPKDYAVEVVEDTAIVEFGPDVPVYIVSIYDPRRIERIALYDIEVNRYTGEVRSFGDFHIIRR